MLQAQNKKIFPMNHCGIAIAVLSLLGAWIVSVPYEGQYLHTLANNFHIDSNELFKASLVLQVVGLIGGGIILKTIKVSKRMLIITIPFCICCTGLFYFKSYWIWGISLLVCSAAAGACIAAFGHFFKGCTVPGQRFKTAATLLIHITVLKLLNNMISMFVSVYAGFAFLAIMLGVAWYLTWKLPDKLNTDIAKHQISRKEGIKALILLFMFIFIIAIDFGIMIQTINPKYTGMEWLTSWYGILPYVLVVTIIRWFSKSVDLSGLLYIAIGMIGLGFILFLVFDYSAVSYLIVTTLMMGAWAVYDVFWWSMLGELLDMADNASIIMGIGFSALMLGVLCGKTIADSTLTISNQGISVFPLAVICIMLIILPILHKSLSGILKSGRPATVSAAQEHGAGVPMAGEYMKLLTEREKQIVELLLKGRTCKLIASDLYVSENTVKTHIKNIYAKLGIRRKSELFTKLTTF